MRQEETADGRVAGDREIDASINFWCWLAILPCSFGIVPYKTTLYLDDEEITKTDVDLCGSHVSKRPYSELGSVDRSTCCCFATVDSALGALAPGWGCNAAAVDEIVRELNGRMKLSRCTGGDGTRTTEQTLERLDAVDAKLDLIMDHLKIPHSQKMMDREES